MDLLNLLEQLTAASGVSGSENSIAAVAQELLTPYCDTVEQRQGNVIGILGERQSGKPHVLLDAHMDQVGFLVTAITEDGFVRVGNAGGLDCRFMPAQRNSWKTGRCRCDLLYAAALAERRRTCALCHRTCN